MSQTDYSRRKVQRTFRPTAKVFLVEDHDFLSITHAVFDVDHYARKTALGVLAFEADSRAEKYLRELERRGYDGVELHRAGNDILFVRYAQLKKVSLFCLPRNNGMKTLYRIKQDLYKGGDKTLAVVLEEEDSEDFKKKFVNTGFNLI